MFIHAQLKEKYQENEQRVTKIGRQHKKNVRPNRFDAVVQEFAYASECPKEVRIALNSAGVISHRLWGGQRVAGRLGRSITLVSSTKGCVHVFIDAFKYCLCIRVCTYSHYMPSHTVRTLMNWTSQMEISTASTFSLWNIFQQNVFFNINNDTLANHIQCMVTSKSRSRSASQPQRVVAKVP